MVYCGKPSRACERCRSRRLKCDQGTPSCSACLRATVDCPGYRDLLSLTFRDQSSQVLRKSRRSVCRKRPVVIATSETTGPTVMAVSPTQRTLAYPSQELAKAYLFVNYISESRHGGHMSYLLPLVQDPRNSTVIAAMTAVGLAALSTLRLSPQLMLKARSQYTTALTRTNQALQDPVMSKRDDILATVVLLGMFEVMICSDDSFIDRWMKHTDGAAKLIEIRGPEQLSRQEGLGLFTYLRTQICISGIYQEKYISPVIMQLTEEAKSHRDSNDQILDQLGMIIIRVINFCASLKDKNLTQPNEIIRTALSLDADLMSVSIAIPPSWSYTTARLPLLDAETITQFMWGDSYHTYSSIAASSMWNNYRSARILIHETILKAVQELETHAGDGPGSQHRCNLINQSRHIARQLVEDICASVPFHLGASAEDNQYLEKSPNEFTDSSSSSVASLSWPPMSPRTLLRTFPRSNVETPHHVNNFYADNSGSETNARRPSTSPFEISGAGGITLVWPLLVAANSGLASSDLRKWIVNCLDKIGHSMGFNQALAAAQLLRNGMNTRAWLQAKRDSTDPRE